MSRVLSQTKKASAFFFFAFGGGVYVKFGEILPINDGIVLLFVRIDFCNINFQDILTYVGIKCKIVLSVLKEGRNG